MSKKAVSRAFTVETIEDGVTYEIQTSVDSITIPANSSQASASGSASFYEKVGSADKTAFTAYYSVYYRTGSTYSRIRSAYANNIPSVVSYTVTSSMNAVVIYLFQSSYTGDSPESQSYIAKKEIVVIKQGDTGSTGPQGKMSRNIYFAGNWNQLVGATFSATDYSAPYVDVLTGTESAPNCYVYKGDNGEGISYPTTQAAYASSSDWELMTSDFKYLITQAIFANFAKLGGAVISGDYMISQYGYILGFGNKRNEILDGSQYQNIDPNDVFGEGDMYDYTELIWNDTTTHTVGVTSQTPLKNAQLEAGKYYTFELDEATGLTGQTLTATLKIGATTIGSISIQSSDDGSTHKHYLNFKCTTTGTYVLYVNVASSGQQFAIVGLLLRQAKFVPYYILDMLQGKICTNNIIARGQLHADSLYYSMQYGNSNDDTIPVTSESIINLGSTAEDSTVVLPSPSTSRGRKIEVFSSAATWYCTWNGAASSSAFTAAYGSGFDYRTDTQITASYVLFYCDYDGNSSTQQLVWWVLKAD